MNLPDCEQLLKTNLSSKLTISKGSIFKTVAIDVIFSQSIFVWFVSILLYAYCVIPI